MAEVEIRPAGEDDVEAMWRLGRQPAVIAGTLQLPSTRLSSRRRRFEELGDGDHFYVAVRHGEVVGFADLHSYERHRRRHAGEIGVMVSPAHGGQGIGTALLRTLIDLADKWLDLRRLELQVYVGNERAIRLYERHGFQVEGRLREYAFTDGAYVDALYMARLRGAGAAAEPQAGIGSSDSAP